MVDLQNEANQDEIKKIKDSKELKNCYDIEKFHRF